MKRLAVLMILAGLSATAFADEPGFCKSMCTSEKSQCLAKVTKAEENEGLLPIESTGKNPFAKTAQAHTRSSDNGALEKAGLQHRREARAGACDTAYQRCTRSCTVDDKKDAVGTVVSRHAK